MSPKMEYEQKKYILVSKMAILAIKRPAEGLNGHLPENLRYPKLHQDVGNCLFYSFGSVWAQNIGLYGCSVKRCWFFGIKLSEIGPGGYLRAHLETLSTQITCIFSVKMLDQKLHFLVPKGLILGPNMAENWFTDQLIGSVVLMCGLYLARHLSTLLLAL